MKPHFLIILFFVLIAACEPAAPKERRYTEITVSPEISMAQDPHAFLNEMPEDPHAFLKNMPQDQDPHAFLNQMPMGDLPVADPKQDDLSWDVPDGWSEKPASGMRLATLVDADTKDPIDCSIVSLGGQAGGLQANVQRWMKQINVSVSSPEELDKFLAKSETVKGAELSASVIDLTLLQSSGDAALPSMIAAIVTTNEKTYFVKMAGSKSAVEKNKSAFTALLKSLKLKAK
ncbi:MAG: hypothetical protein WC676_05420 [Candidatus Omnitrophota bacterium]